jgi:23S rRNA pseudouridine1911/1915/1917 synthase
MPRPVELDVPVEARGARLDAWLGQALESASRSAVARLIDSDRVTIDGRSKPRSFRLAGGEHVVVEQTEARPVAPAAVEATIVFADDSLLVIDKPAGLVVHPAPGHATETLSEQLERGAAGAWKPCLVHRLDRDTSGLMVVAKDEQTQLALQSQLRRRELIREYLALISGRLASRSGTIDAPIGRDRRRRTRMSIDSSKARQAVTHFELERTIGGYSLLRMTLETGRTHQIRAHLSAIGHPICGDSEYDGREIPGLRRQFLHSTRIAFAHPAGGQPLEWRSELPGDLSAALEQISLPDG